MRTGSDFDRDLYNDDNHGSSFGLLGFFTGLAAGAALGVLFAPKSGREMREDIVEAGERTREKMDDLIENGREEWSRLRGKAVDMATMTRDEVSDFVHYLFSEGRDLRSRVKNDVRSGASKVGARTSQMADDIRRGV
jgi:gas vesicle protein